MVSIRALRGNLAISIIHWLEAAQIHKFGQLLKSPILSGLQPLVGRPISRHFNWATLYTMLILLSQIGQPLPADAYKPGAFPGKGDYQTWRIANGLSNHGGEFVKSGSYDQAIEKFKAAVARYPYEADYFKNLGFAYEKRDHPGDLAKTEAAYRQAVKLNPDDWHHWSDLSEVLYGLNRNSESRAALEQAIKCNPSANDLHDLQDNLRQLDADVTSKRIGGK